MNISTNYSFKKPTLSDSANIEDISDSIEAIDNTIKSVEDANLVQTSTGTANAIILTLPTTLSNGYQVTFIASANNTGSATTVNGKNLYKPGGSNPTLIKDKAYNIYYNSSSDSFFVVANASGNTVSAHVLAGDTFSNDFDTDLVGTLDLSLLISANIRSGITINGVNGNSNVVNTSDAVLDPQYLLTGYSGYDDGVKKNGTMANLGSSQNAVDTWQSGSGQLVFRVPSKGAFTGVVNGYKPEVSAYDADFVASNIVSGKNIFGLDGTATISSMGGAQFASGTAVPFKNGTTTSAPACIDISSCGFTPNIVLLHFTGWYIRDNGNTSSLSSDNIGMLTNYGNFLNNAVLYTNSNYDTFGAWGEAPNFSDLAHFEIFSSNVQSITGTCYWIAMKLG